MSETKREDKYIQFPLCLLQQTYLNHKTGLNLILDFGIVNYAMKFKYEIEEVGRQLMYAYYRKTDMMQNYLELTIDKYVENDQLSIDQDYCGFVGNAKSFDPLDFSSELLGLFESNMEFKEAAILLYQIRQAEKSLGISDPNVDRTIKGYNEALVLKNQFELKYGADVMPSIKPTLLFEYRDNEKDINVFRAIVAIRSIFGRNNFGTSNKPAILSRMIGCKSKAAFEYFRKNKQFIPTIEKYSKKYHMDNLLLTLAKQKQIMFLSKAKISVIYLSKYMEPEDLSRIIKETKVRQDLKKRIRDATASL